MLLLLMSTTTTLLLLVLFQSAAAFAPFQQGPHPAVQRTIYGMGNPGLNNRLDIWIPDPAASLKAPLLFSLTGMGGLMPGFLYNNVFDRLASHGMAVISVMSSGPSGETYEGLWLEDVMVWVEDHLADKLEQDGVAENLVLDHRTKYLLGHSSGAHVVVAYLTHHCGDVKGQILFSPVDGFDPFGWIPNYIIQPGEYLNYALPTLILMAGLDSVSGLDGLGNLLPACAPEELSNLRFYAALPGNTWLVNATQFGHADCLDETYASGIEFTHFCSSADKTADRDSYRAHIAGQIVSFLTLIAGGESCTSEQYLQDTSLMPVPATVMQKGSSLAQDNFGCGQAHCVWQEAPFPAS